MKDMDGCFGSINQPTAGASTEKALPRGKHPLQLYSLATPNGIKIGIFPWYGSLVKGKLYGTSAEFLAVHDYHHVIRWADLLIQREGVLRGRLVNRTSGDADQLLPERHSADDFVSLDITYR